MKRGFSSQSAPLCSGSDLFCLFTALYNIYIDVILYSSFNYFGDIFEISVKQQIFCHCFSHVSEEAGLRSHYGLNGTVLPVVNMAHINAGTVFNY